MAYLGGPGIWTYRPAVEAVVDIGELEDYPSNTLPGLYERLTAWLPGLIEHRCSPGRRGGFLMRLRDGTWAGHILEHVALELQTQAGMKTGFGKARMTGERGVYKVVIRTRDAAVGKAALQAGRDLLMAAIHGTPFDVAAVHARLADMAERRCLGPSTACIVEAAGQRGIPAIRLSEGNLVQLGHGAAQRRIWTAETDRTSAIAEGISRDKDLTKQLLAAAGVPVPEGRTAASPDQAWEAAQDIGLPVAVKPVDANHGRGVSLNLTTRQEVQDAWATADKEGSEVIVERFIPGDEHRLLVVGGKLAAATRGQITRVSGDGRSTIEQLVAAHVNADPRRGAQEHLPLDVILVRANPVTQLELARQGLTADSVLPVGQTAVVERTGNMAVDVTGQVHPGVAEIAALAARVVGLDIAGIDVVAGDIGQPLAPQGGAVVEVNAGPSLLMHLKPAVGRTQPVGEAIVNHLFPDGAQGRIPLVGVLALPGQTLLARLVGDMLGLSGLTAAVAGPCGLQLGERWLTRENAATSEAGERVLLNRAVQAAVLQTSPRQILEHGLPYDRCQVGIVTAMPDPEGLADHYITEAEQMPAIVRTQVDVVLKTGAAVLNAADPAVRDLAAYCDGEVIFYADLDRAGEDTLQAIAAHLAGGKSGKGRAVLLRGGQIVLAQGKNETPLATTTLPPSQALPAAACAWHLQLTPALIRASLLRCAVEVVP
ncbi:MAG: cyanophycin synthetase [Burkholderiaceae bacterium]|nr:cyanophycin synthetase [Burkholderiaceae bacterium]